MSEPAFDPLMALRTLLDHDVRFVLIGGFTGALRRSPVITGDVDICYAGEDSRIMSSIARRLLSLVEGRLTSNVVSLR